MEQMKKCQNSGCKSLENGRCKEILYNLSKGIKEYMPVELIEKCTKWAKNEGKVEVKEVKSNEKDRT